MLLMKKCKRLSPMPGLLPWMCNLVPDWHRKISVTVAGQSYGGSHAFDSEASDYTISDGLLGGLFSFRNTTVPSKALRFCSATIVQMLCLSDTQLPENKWRGLSPDTNYIKYSNGYYVYTLGYILI